MKDAHDRAYEILVSHREQMDLMASVLLERETVEGEACLALLDNTWDDYLKHEGEINARKEAEEQAARERDAKLADPNWKEEPVDVSSAVFCIIGNIRQKLREVTTKEYIQTVWGVGYKFVDVPGE